jgi:hypothetical protein
MVESTEDFMMLYGSPKFLDSKLVKSFAIVSPAFPAIWEDEYSVTLSRLSERPAIDMSVLSGFDPIEATLANEPAIPTERCDGSIDMLNGVLPAPAKSSVSGLLKVEGWLAANAASGTLAQATYVTLTDSEGKRIFLRTHGALRPDVGAHYKQPGLAAAGYNTTVDISALSGTYALGLAYREGSVLKVCGPRGQSISVRQ